MAQTVPIIAALRPVQAWQAQQPGLPVPTLPQVGELLRLTVTSGSQGQLLAGNAQGVLMGLSPGTAAVGDELLMRVLATQPRLELQMVERRGGTVPQASSSALPEDTAALRTDQAWMQQRFQGARAALAQGLPATVAAQWRGRVLAEVMRGGGGGSTSTTAVEPPVPAAAAASLEGAAAPRPGGEAIALQGWQGQALLLRLLSPQGPALPLPGCETEEAPPRQPGDQEAEAFSPEEPGEGLRLGLILSLNGDWVQVVLQWQQGLLLHVSADKPATLQMLRGLMPRIAAALAAVPLRLRHCQLSSQPPAAPPLPQAQQSHGLAHSSSGALFRAAAEIAKVLQQA